VSDFVLLAGTANPPLTAAVAGELGVALGACSVERHPDGEVRVRLEEPVRKRQTFLLQPTSPPVNDHLAELLALADACRRGAARSVTAVVPYFGYARGDKRQTRSTPIMASLVADMMQAAGIQHVVTLDLHVPQIEGFFRIPVEALSAAETLCAALRGRLPDDVVVVSPDLGGVRRAVEYGERLGAPVAVCQKQRVDGARVAVTRVIGDVRGRSCLIVDDMISTGGTIVESARVLLESGARPGPQLAATHGVLLPGAREALAGAGVRDLLVTDSVATVTSGPPPTTVVSVAALLGSEIRRLAAGPASRPHAGRPAQPAPRS
jgi:ribose-phosphate pyrophosphokinase